MSRGDWDSRSSGRGTWRGDDFDEDADPRGRQGSRRGPPPGSRDPRSARDPRNGRSDREYDDRRDGFGGSSRGERGSSRSPRDGRDERYTRDPRPRRDPRDGGGERDYDDRRGERGTGGPSRDGGRSSTRRPPDADGWDERGRPGSRGPERSRARDDYGLGGPGGARGGSRDGDRSMARGTRAPVRDDPRGAPSRSGSRWADESMESPRARRGTPPVAPGRGGRPGLWDDEPQPGGVARGRDARGQLGGARGGRAMGRPGVRTASRQPQSSTKSIAIIFGLVLLALALGAGAGYFYYYKIEKVPPPPTSATAVGIPQSALSGSTLAGYVLVGLSAADSSLA